MAALPVGSPSNKGSPKLQQRKHRPQFMPTLGPTLMPTLGPNLGLSLDPCRPRPPDIDAVCPRVLFAKP